MRSGLVSEEEAALRSTKADELLRAFAAEAAEKETVSKGASRPAGKKADREEVKAAESPEAGEESEREPGGGAGATSEAPHKKPGPRVGGIWPRHKA